MSTAVFDFDNTLTYRDTLLGFYVHCNRGSQLVLVCKLGIYLAFALLHKLSLLSNDALKHLGVRLFLRGASEKWIRDKAREYSGQIELNCVYHDYLSRFDSVYIVTASFREYVEHVFPNQKVIGSELMYRDGKVAAVRVNCHGKTKVKMLKSAGVDQCDCFFTDSRKDLPVAQIATKAFLVRGDEVLPWPVPGTAKTHDRLHRAS